jgi:hypothetical protein
LFEAAKYVNKVTKEVRKCPNLKERLIILMERFSEIVYIGLHRNLCWKSGDKC